MLLSILEQSLLFLPLAIGIYISYGVLRIPDLTTDGSFLIGAALFGVAVTAGLSPPLAILVGTLGGMGAGALVSLLQTKLSLNPLIAGILLVFILNTLTLKIMGKPNISLFDAPSIFNTYPKIAVLLSLGTLLLIGAAALLASRCGLGLYAFGNNPTLLNLSGKNANQYRMLGLILSNGLVGYSGTLTAQVNGYVDIGMGTGIVLIALGTVIIGEQLYRTLFAKKTPFAPLFRLFACFLGVIIYFSTVSCLISLGLDPIYLRMMIGICLIGFLSMTRGKNINLESAA